MKSFLNLLAVLCTGTVLNAQDKAVLREISATYDQIEENHKSWTHYATLAENVDGGHSFINHLWISEGDEKLSKLEVLHYEDHGESKLQFFFKGDELVFTLERTETSLIEPKPGTDVDEKRYYFASSKLIRVLEKKARFPAGKSTDTASTKARVVDLSEIENAEETYTLQHELTAPMVNKLLHINDDAAETGTPAAGNAPVAASGFTTVGDGWRMIVGTASRDGVYALAWGMKGQSAAKGEIAEDGSLSGEDQDENLVNYVVNVRTKEIVGPIKGAHFGDKPTYNHSVTETSWSAASDYVAQTNSGKWATYDSTVYALQNWAATTISQGTDLLEPTKKAILEHLEGSDVFKKFDKDAFTYTLHDLSITRRGGSTVVVIEVSGMIPKSEEEGSNFEATVAFDLQPDENGGAPVVRWRSTEGH